MKRLGAAVSLLMAAGSGLLGLLFLLGSGGQLRRLVAAAILLALAGIFGGLGIRLIRSLTSVSPERLEAEILQLARVRNGELSETDLRAALGTRLDAAAPVLTRMTRAGTSQPAVRDGVTYYVFPDLQPRLVERHCQHCGTELPVTEQRESCPNCGATLRSRVARRSLSAGDHYQMDE